jgi:hypothetical protein
MAAIDFKEQLRRQIGFIERSCDAYDRGFADEAVRIATVLRVIFHNTKQSTSLLHHLGNPHIKILTQSSLIPDGAIFGDGIGLKALRADTGDVASQPKLGRGHLQAYLASDLWWAQLVYVRNDIRITRRDVVLTAANKDGGAHVDAQLTKEYLELSEGVWTANWGTSNERRIEDHQFVLLRDAGFEVLNSPDLLALAK